MHQITLEEYLERIEEEDRLPTYQQCLEEIEGNKMERQIIEIRMKPESEIYIHKGEEYRVSEEVVKYFIKELINEHNEGIKIVPKRDIETGDYIFIIE